jgi:hypothetical protein
VLCDAGEEGRQLVLILTNNVARPASRGQTLSSVATSMIAGGSFQSSKTMM